MSCLIDYVYFNDYKRFFFMIKFYLIFSLSSRNSFWQAWLQNNATLTWKQRYADHLTLQKPSLCSVFIQDTLNPSSCFNKQVSLLPVHIISTVPYAIRWSIWHPFSWYVSLLLFFFWFGFIKFYEKVEAKRLNCFFWYKWIPSLVHACMASLPHLI